MPTLKQVLDLNPWREEKLDEALFLDLIAERPEELQMRYQFDAFDDDELYPLHMVSALGASLDCIKAAYKAHPAAMQLTETSLGGPVHFACAFDATVDVIHFLAKKDPEALKRPNDSDEQTPLHLACRCTWPVKPDVVAFLTERCPEAALMTDSNGNTPLNLVCRADNPPLAAVEDLTEVHPSAGTVKASDGTWPLWNALRHDADSAIIKDLIISNPESALLIGSSGFTALHRALDNDYHVTLILKDLTKANPKILQTKDDKGRIPLHFAIERNVTFPIIKLFVQRCPDTVDEENADGETPFKLSERLGRDDEIVRFLNPYEEDPTT